MKLRMGLPLDQLIQDKTVETLSSPLMEKERRGQLELPDQLEVGFGREALRRLRLNLRNRLYS